MALCCVALAFRSSSEFAFDKAPGTPCLNLDGDDRCSIHPRLRESGCRGCVAFDCFGAGQQVTEHVVMGRHWRSDPGAAGVFATFDVLRRLRELLFHVLGALATRPEGQLGDDLLATRITLEDLIRDATEDLERLDVIALQAPVIRLLERTAASLREVIADPSGFDAATVDLSAAVLGHANLRGADLRYTRLVGSVLVGADLSGADLFGADLHDADVRGAALADSLFLTQLQLEVMNGDEDTTIPAELRRPAHWGTAGAGTAK